jgi:hypothetical protein
MQLVRRILRRLLEIVKGALLLCSWLNHLFANVLAKDLDLQIIAPPIRLPRIDILQYWHERFHRDPGSQWIRSVFKALFGKGL